MSRELLDELWTRSRLINPNRMLLLNGELNLLESRAALLGLDLLGSREPGMISLGLFTPDECDWVLCSLAATELDWLKKGSPHGRAWSWWVDYRVPGDYLETICWLWTIESYLVWLLERDEQIRRSVG